MSKILFISDEKLEEVAKRIKPVFRYSKSNFGTLSRDPEGELLFYSEDVEDLRNEDITWDPKPKVLAEGLEYLTDIVTYHKFDIPVHFQTSVAEVIAQIPEEYIDRVAAFETVFDGLGLENFLAEGYHVTITRLYEKKQRKF